MRDVLSPFTAWKHLFREPVTVLDPLNDRPGADRYRGFHQNDLEKCIGCGTCEVICQNAAIDMVPVSDPEDGDSGLRPMIDYGRCCWCALCVDVCMTGSLTMSNDYVWADANPDVFRFTPGVDPKPWNEEEKGYQRPGARVLASTERVHMGERTAKDRIDNFEEIVAGYTREEAMIEADRCVECGLCVATCPAHMDIPDYIKAIREQDYDKGLQLLYQTNPFSEVCGRVCTHNCETACAARHDGDPIAIRWLKRHITDEVPYERYVDLIGKPEAATGRKVAIVGSGPAGLTTAYDLARMGHKVVVYEARKSPGGMPRYGIPEYRLPYDMLDRDIDVIRAMGVEIVCNTRIGEDITMETLRADNDAVVLSIGLHLGRSTRIPGAESPDVDTAVPLLRKITDGEEVPVPEKLVVIGGGNVAMDIARSMARLQQVKHGKVGVTVTALESFDHFLADADEVRESREEGIEIFDARGPQEIVTFKSGKRKGRVKGLRTWLCDSIFDDQGRFNPHYDESDELVHPADMVIEAIGQAADVSILGKDLTEALEWTRGRIRVDVDGQTSEPWLWSAGDCVNGPDVVHAVADGHRVAQSINAMLAAKEEAAT
ncbi:FAD-dependent oxidoreductase [Aliiroseovarius subalbicans]|uniref:FAD-dependent oxidoreductase n=1 Tax=Aliiroseovarius subalbicans TaxID=2925840 RepID=UPI001F591D81|nr:FAD-dependent oxidoreductase [Aliiroseovarius subalbicans]MCI2400860.1 FAD-dependent oxidoreductase [Aliiroseovarius subalbicans]